jgi:nucleoside-diphosphate-sugar epimerase
MTMSKSIFIPGGAGYLGSVLVGRLLGQGYKVIVYDNLMYSQSSLLQYCSNPNFKFIWGDVENKNIEYLKLLTASDYIFPLAALVGAPSSNRELRKSATINHSSIVKIVKECNKYNPNVRIIFPTTNSGYGTKSGEIVCDETTPLEPISPYGRDKVAAEKALLENYKNVITLRLATVFGVSPRMRLDLLVNYSVWKAVTDKVLCVPEDIKDNMRNYIHILDVADCFLFCIENFDKMKGEPFNVGNYFENRSVLELSEQIARQVGCELVITRHYKDPDKRNYIVNNDKIKRFGFQANRIIASEIPNLIKVCEMIKMTNYGRTPHKNA